MSDIILYEKIENKILLIRKQKVMLDRDLAELYGVPTKRLNEQIKRNIKRFPEDFMFQLNKIETNELVANCDRFDKLKHSSVYPLVFTEQGIAMLSSVLNSDRAIKINITIMRAFVKIRQLIYSYKDLVGKIEEIEKKYDTKIKKVFEVLDFLIKAKEEDNKNKELIGFKER